MVRVAGFLTVLRVAVIVALTLLATETVLIEKVADFAPAAIVIAAGT
jgi:hypothetical protein